MRIYQLTGIGQNLASNPTSQQTTAMKVLYWLRRHGGRGTDEQMRTFVDASPSDIHMAVNNLVRMKAIVPIG